MPAKITHLTAIGVATFGWLCLIGWIAMHAIRRLSASLPVPAGAPSSIGTQLPEPLARPSYGWQQAGHRHHWSHRHHRHHWR
jgi:hypothetical protein